MNEDEINSHRITAHLSRAEGGERFASDADLAKKRATDLYEQMNPNAPFILVGRSQGETPVAVARDFTKKWDADARILRNFLDCDVWRLEPEPPIEASSPYRMATVWKAPDENGEIEPALEELKVSDLEDKDVGK